MIILLCTWMINFLLRRDDNIFDQYVRHGLWKTMHGAHDLKVHIFSFESCTYVCSLVQSTTHILWTTKAALAQYSSNS